MNLAWLFRAALSALAVFLAVVSGAGADGPSATITLDSQGFCIATPGDEPLVLRFPTLFDATQQPVKSVGAKATGNTASIEYPQGAKLEVTRSGATVTLHFTGLTETTKGFRMEMTLPGEFKDGGKFQLKGEDVKPFPTEFGGEQYVFKGAPKPVTLIGPRGGAFTVAMPYGWHQVQDGRKWNSPNFDYLFTTAMPRGDNNEAWFTFKLWSSSEPKSAEAKPKAKPAPAPRAQATSLRLTREGLAIEAGSAGHFTLAYPVFVGAKWDDVRKPVETTMSGNNAALKFDGDARVEVTLELAAKTLTLTPVAVPAGVKSPRSTARIRASGGSRRCWRRNTRPSRRSTVRGKRRSRRSATSPRAGCR
jgi:hypothetical protein